MNTVPISHDCRDGLMGAYRQRRESCLDRDVVMAISGLGRLDPGVRERGPAVLPADLESGAWAERHAGLAARTELDLGYRLLIARHN